ncbi:hypothetical protein MKZ38_007241 [Zalerion maritima]|uniref:Uncharacterized protein n=1 Tax=Zalerion maritima TaxID=339359 RepID=A0AAD5WPA5_9PEZI|nr:hypothetical protein MKZ38_007241 [Zalerion maritima]
MAIDASVQALVAAFSFGIVFNAASAGLFLYIKGHGSSIFRDGLRLVLITFFASAALWAQLSFVATIIDQSATSPCRVALIFTTIFDQLARVAVEQYLLWAVAQHRPGKMTIAQLIPQILLLGRIIVGGVFVGFTRADFSPVCSPVSTLFPIAIATIALDAIIVAALGVGAFSSGMYEQMRDKKEEAGKSKAVFFSILGLAVWTASSVPMELGMGDTDLILRTAVPAGGLTILITIIVASAGNIVVTRSKPSGYPEAPSPRQISSSRDISSSDSEYPPSNYEDVKGGTVRTRMSTFSTPREAPKPGDARLRPGMPRAVTGMNGLGGVPLRNNLFPAPAAAAAVGLNRSISGPRKIGGKMSISNPVLQQGPDGNNPLRKIVTIDLAAAARAEKERREGALQREPDFTATRAAPQPPMMMPIDAIVQREKSIKRKEVASTTSSQAVPTSELEPMPNGAATTSAQLSPAGQDIKRRSPRQPPREIQVEAARPRTPPKSPLRLMKISPPRPPRPDSLNIDQVASPRIMTSIPSPKTPRRTRPSSPAKSAKSIHPPPSPSPPKLPLSMSSPRRAPQPPRAPSPPEVPSIPMASWPEQTRKPMQPPVDGKPLERKVTPPKKITRSSAFPLQPVPRKPSLSREEEEATIVAPVPPLPPGSEDARMPNLDRSGSARVQEVAKIRPSRKYTDPETPNAEPVKTPLQRRMTSGLPGNPRARAMKAMAAETGPQREQTVMFVNNIQYNDPTGVQNIIDGAAKSSNYPQSATSVVNRPRPIPRKPEEDSPFFPAEPPPHGHRRTKSGGSVTSRKSILQSSPGSPTALPPLPPPPTNLPRSAGIPDRPLPNDTKSMTFDEKMTLLFPAPPSGGNPDNRNSSVPEMPQIPATYYEIATSPGDSMTSDGENLMSRQSKASQRTVEVRGSDHLGESNRAMRNMEAGGSWLPSMDGVSSVGPSYDGTKRKSSPVIPHRASAMAMAGSTDEAGSVHSPAKAVNIQQSLNPRAMYIQRDSEKVVPSAISEGGEVMMIRLDLESLRSAQMNRSSWYGDDEIEDSDDDMDMDSRRHSQFHHRPGDSCPTFSARQEKTRSRKMVPPTPLLINSISHKAPVPMRESSPPIESPTNAIVAIQDQLRNFEEPKRGSTGSRDGQRMTLLQNLEQEMGHLDNKWAAMQSQLGRDSMSSVQTDSRRESLIASQPGLSIAERRACRRSHLQNNIALKSSWSTSSSETTRASIFQSRLAEAQAQYTNRAPELLQKRNRNFLATSNPTPPDSDDSDEDTVAVVSSTPKPNFPMLWRPASPAPAASIESALWNPPAKRRRLDPEPFDLPGLAVRPALRKTEQSLNIESWNLWQQSETPKIEESHEPHLWGECPKQNAATAKRTTQRPPRRGRRVTLLPDILESPEPLPENAATLGIFQFPWGEKSDTATIQPRISTMYMAMPGTMTTGGPAINRALEARSKEVESSEYSSSFFEDYEEDDGLVASGSDSDEPSDDDDFDEATLWEIASLLKTNVPSKDSIMPRRDMADNQMEDSYSDVVEETEESSFFDEDDDASIVAPLKMKQLVNPLWDGKPESSPAKETGLPQPSDWGLWYVSEHDDTVRVPTRRAEPATIESTTLWAPALSETGGDGMAPLWTEPRPVQNPTAKKMPGTKGPKSGMMWVAKAKEIKASKGLPQPDEEVWKAYQPAGDRARSPPRHSEIEPIHSSSLWKSGSEKTQKDEVAPLWAALKPKIAKAKNVAIPAPMWAGKAVKVQVSKGLPQPDDWDSYQTTGPRARSLPRKAELEPVESSDLWAPPGVKTVRFESEPLWAKPVSKPIPQMWTQPAIQSKNAKGLPQPENWDDYQPSGDRSRSPPHEGDFDMTITSTSLWQPESLESRPIAASPLWSASLKAQKAPSTLWKQPSPFPERSLSPNGMFQAGSARTDYRSTTEEPAAKSMARKPRPSDDPKPLDQLTSKNLWTSRGLEDNSRDWMSASSRPGWQKEIHHQWRRPAAYSADWETALAEAVALSFPMVRPDAADADWKSALAEAVSRSFRVEFPKASRADWAAALAEAITASKPKPAFDVSVKHPVFAASNLATTSEIYHPAATGYIYGIDKVHPAFFGSKPIDFNMPVELVHPAISEYASRKLRRAHPIPAEFVSPSTKAKPEAAALAAQIEALEREKEFAARFATQSIYLEEPIVYVDEPIVDSPVYANTPLYGDSQGYANTPGMDTTPVAASTPAPAPIPTIVAPTPEPEHRDTMVHPAPMEDSWPLAPTPVQNINRSSSQNLQDEMAAEAVRREMEIAAEIMAEAEMVYAEPSPIFVPQQQQQLWNHDNNNNNNNQADEEYYGEQQQPQQTAAPMWQQPRSARQSRRMSVAPQITRSSQPEVMTTSEEDRAAVRRARKSGIQARIAALEQGGISSRDSAADTAHQGLWSKRGSVTSVSGNNSGVRGSVVNREAGGEQQQRDWLEDSSKKRFSKVELRY